MADGGGIDPQPSEVRTHERLLAELERLRVRAARGRGKPRVSLKDIASASGVPRSTLANYLSGVTFIPADQLDAVVLAMGASSAETAEWAAAWERAMAHRMAASGAPSAGDPALVNRTRRLLRPSRWAVIGLLSTVGVVAVAGAAWRWTREAEPADASKPTASAPAFPSADTTGVPPGTRLTPYSGDLGVGTPGAVVEGMQVTGRIIVTAPDVTIRRTKVVPVGPARYSSAEGCSCGIMQQPSARNLVVEDTEIAASVAKPTEHGITGWGEGLTVRRVNVHGVEKGVIISTGARVSDSFVHGLMGFGRDPGGVVTAGGDADVEIRHNTILNPTPNGAAILFFDDLGPMVNIRIEGNLLAGGAHAFFAGVAEGSFDMRSIGNRFSRQFFPGSGAYGPIEEWNSAATGNLWRDNVWHDTGEPVQP